ncbi:unnamed protein product [Trifolium pratense]|uniref:Uncharacterized protein n=1 Tax=Trifolium pratense TaxID=57577 RepID=A0ACB0ICJ2_TRIPR|nr:unnamed protein product [Trifolium pratense]
MDVDEPLETEKNSKLHSWTFNDSANPLKFSNDTHMRLIYCDFYHFYIFVLNFLSFGFFFKNNLTLNCLS